MTINLQLQAEAPHLLRPIFIFSSSNSSMTTNIQLFVVRSWKSLVWEGNKLHFLFHRSCANTVTSPMFSLCRLSSVGRASHSYRFLSFYASFLGNQGVKRSLKRGTLNRSAVGNPVLIPLGMSVETLHDPPKALWAMVKRKSRPQTSLLWWHSSQNGSAVRFHFRFSRQIQL